MGANKLTMAERAEMDYVFHTADRILFCGLLSLNFEYSITLYHFDICVQVPVRVAKIHWDHL